MDKGSNHKTTKKSFKSLLTTMAVSFTKCVHNFTFYLAVLT